MLIHTSAGTLTTGKGKGRERNREFIPRFRSRDSERFCSRLIPNRSQRPRFRSQAGIDRDRPAERKRENNDDGEKTYHTTSDMRKLVVYTPTITSGRHR